MNIPKMSIANLLIFILLIICGCNVSKPSLKYEMFNDHNNKVGLIEFKSKTNYGNFSKSDILSFTLDIVGPISQKIYNVSDKTWEINSLSGKISENDSIESINATFLCDGYKSECRFSESNYYYSMNVLYIDTNKSNNIIVSFGETQTWPAIEVQNNRHENKSGNMTIYFSPKK